MIKIATTALNIRCDKEANLKKFLHYIEEAARQKADLVVFPELGLQGIPSSMLTYSPDECEYQQNAAELVPEGETTQLMIGKAKEHNLYICWGMTEASHSHPGTIFNTCVLVGPEGFVGKYRKVHNPMTERLYMQPGCQYDVFDTKIGKIGLMVCFDKAFPETARSLALKGAEIIVGPTCWPWPTYPDEKDFDAEAHVLYERVRALENQVFYVSSNVVGEMASGGHECGLSQIVDPKGEILVSTNMYNEGMVTAEIDVQQELKDVRGGLKGMHSNLLKDRRPDTYGQLTAITRYSFMGGLENAAK